MCVLCNISKTSATVSPGFQTRENWWKHEAACRVLLLFSIKLRWNKKHEFLQSLLQQKKISLNYLLNKFSQFNYYIWDVKYAWTSKKCVWCAWSYHLIAALWQFLNIQQLRSRCLVFVSSERTRCFAKQMAECRFRPRKTSTEEEKWVASAIPR